MLDSSDLKALVTHPSTILVFLVACFFGFSYQFFLAETSIPLHDAGLLFQVFKTAYSNYFFTGDLPEWLPHAVYGHHTHLENILRLSPLTYPIMVLGKFFGVLDTLVMFKMVILLEILVFCCGFLLLANALFENKYIALFAVTPLLLTTIVINQIYFSFRIVYLVPLMTYYILRFSKTGNVNNFIFVIVITIASLYGNVVYFIVYYFIYCIVVFSSFLYIYRNGFRLVYDRFSAGAALLALLFVGISGHLILTSTDELSIVLAGRDPLTLRVDLDTFLTYGRGGIIKTLEILMAVPFSNNNVTFYIPAAALVFVAYALCRERSAVFLAVAAIFAFMLVLSWGRYSPLAYAIYYIPGASYFRHIGLMYAVPKMLLCLIAGFGIKRFLEASAGGEGVFRRECRFLAVISTLVAITVITVLGLILTVPRNLEVDSIRLALMVLSAMGFVAFAATAVIPTLRRRILLGSWMAIMILQGGGYLVGVNTLFSNNYEIDPTIKSEIAATRAYPFEETRLVMSDHPRFHLWDTFIQGPFFYQNYTNLYGALGIDPCYPVMPRNRIDFYASVVGDLARHLFGRDADIRKLGDYYKRSPDALFFRLAGCNGRTKLQLIRRFDEEALAPQQIIPPKAMNSAVLVERTDTGERRLVRMAGGEHPRTTTLAGKGITIIHFSANRLVATVRVPGPSGAWLVYADAFDSTWRATIDGSPAPVWKANMAFKAVFVPSGTHAVSFDCTRPLYQAALWFVAIFSIGIMILGCAPLYRLRTLVPGAP